MIIEDLFIIPNAACPASEFRKQDMDWLSGRLYRQTGVKIEPNDVVIQATVKDWNRFGSFQESLGVQMDENILDASREGRQVGYFAEYWPLRIFEGHKEGDEITLTSPEYGIEYKLRLAQRPSRYGRISTTVVTEGGGLGVAHLGEFDFERVLNLVTRRGEFA